MGILSPYSFGQSYNRYAYVSNNPLSFTDPTGHYGLCDSGDQSGCGGGTFSFCGYCASTAGPASPSDEQLASLTLGVVHLIIGSLNNAFGNGFTNQSMQMNGRDGSGGYTFSQSGSIVANPGEVERASVNGLKDYRDNSHPSSWSSPNNGFQFASTTIIPTWEAELGAGLSAAGARALGVFSLLLNLSGDTPRDRNTQLVIRGGLCTAEQFCSGSGVTVDANGNLQGISVNSFPNTSVQQLSQTIPNKQIGVTNTQLVQDLGGIVTPAPTPGNPYHAILSGITPAQAQALFTPTFRNPNRE
jgi:hypothetical protein